MNEKWRALKMEMRERESKNERVGNEMVLRFDSRRFKLQKSLRLERINNLATGRALKQKKEKIRACNFRSIYLY